MGKLKPNVTNLSTTLELEPSTVRTYLSKGILSKNKGSLVQYVERKIAELQHDLTRYENTKKMVEEFF